MSQPEYERIRRFQLSPLFQSGLLHNLLVRVFRLAVVKIQISLSPSRVTGSSSTSDCEILDLGGETGNHKLGGDVVGVLFLHDGLVWEQFY